MSQMLQNLLHILNSTRTTVLIILVPRKTGAANTTGSMQVMWIDGIEHWDGGSFPEDLTNI